MKHPFFLPPPTRLNQATNENNASDTRVDPMTRRRFLKRAGGATVATAVAWNLTINQANAAPVGSSGSLFMCAISPPYLDASPGNPVGYTLLPGGGFLYLYHKDDVGCQEDSGNHRKKNLNSWANLYAVAWVPQKTRSGNWYLHPKVGTAEMFEKNAFSFSGGAIIRTNLAMLPVQTWSRVLGDLPDGDALTLYLEVTSITRSSSSVTIKGKAWLEGEVGGVTYDDLLAAQGSGISVVAPNQQAEHQPNACGVLP